MIRHATIDDLDAIAGVEAMCFPAAEAADKTSFERRLNTFADCFWLMIDDDMQNDDVQNDGVSQANDATQDDGVTQADAALPTTPCVTEGPLIGFVNGMATNTADLLDDMYDDASLHNPSGEWQMIFGVDTAPAYQHRGYATNLLKHVIEEARSRGRRGLVLTCKERLLGFYANVGFEDEGISDSTHGDVVWHQMRLTF